jgi:stage II sporulation protein P
LGDWGGEEDNLSPAAVLTLAESPLLLSARESVAGLLSTEPPETPQEPVAQRPLEETPLDPAPLPTEGNPDNGVTAKTLVPESTDGYTVADKVYITNSTDHQLTIQDLTAPFDAGLTAEEPQILIIHTHGSEAYTPPPGTEVTYSGDLRSTDNRYNVVAVGDAMAQEFGELGISVLHDRTLYDYPNYAGSYDRSLAAIDSFLAQYPSIHFILDVHRDAIEDTEGNESKVVSPVEGEGNAAQITIVVGSDGSGLPHPNWMENLKLAVGLQQDISQLYPTLLRPILLRNSRYNQQATTGSLLLEVGAAGNSPAEAALAGRLFAREMGTYLEEKSK